MRKLVCLLLLFPVLFLSSVSCANKQKTDAEMMKHKLTSTSGYNAVLLTNGQVYFGKIEGAETGYPVLRDVYYIQSAKEEATSKVSFVLVKRGKEAHAPDRMVLNAQHILLIEPVSKGSKVSDLISVANQEVASQQTPIP